MATIVNLVAIGESRRTPGGTLDVGLTGVPVELYVRGRQTRDRTSGYLLDEAIRFFNFGTQGGPQAPGAAYLTKSYPAIAGGSFRDAVVDLAGAVSPRFYRHIERLYDPLGTLGGVNAKKGGAKLIGPGLLGQSDYATLLIGDRQQNALMVHRLLFEGWASPKAKPNVFDFQTLASIHGDAITQIRKFHDQAPIDMGRAAADRYLVSADLAPMVGDDRLGGNDTLAPAADASFLAAFAPSGDPNEIGLSEKVLSTLIVVASLDRSGLQPSEDFLHARSGSTQSLERELMKLNAKSALATGPHEAFSGSKRTIDRWSLGISHTRAWLSNCASALPALIPDPIAARSARSDLVWGLILNDYLDAVLLHARILVTYAAFPFRQIYAGGSIAPLASEASVKGLSGLLSVACWETLAATPQPHPGTSHAHTSFQPTPVVDQKTGIVPQVWAQPPDKLVSPTLMRPLPLHETLSLGTPRTAHAAAFAAELAGSDAPRMLDLIASANSQEIPPRRIRKTRASNAESAEVYRARLLDSVLTGNPGLRFAGAFAPGMRVNPPVHPSLFAPVAVTPAARRPLLSTWGKTSRFSFGAQLETQLHLYVLGWLYQWWRAARTGPGVLGDRLIFTCGSGMYGGVFQPHLTHRTGDSVDLTLWDGSDRWYYTMVHWPHDNERPSRDEPVFASRRPGAPSSLLDASRTLRLALRTLLSSAPPAGAEQSQKAELARTARREAERQVTAILSRIALARQRAFPVRPNADRLDITAVVPEEAMLCTWYDDWQRRGAVPASLPRTKTVAYREFLRSILNSELGSAATALQRAASPTEVIAKLLEIEDRFGDWPIMPNRASHFSHHAGHLAVVLSLPVDFIWAAPLYHLRALRVIGEVLLEANVALPWRETSEGAGLPLPEMLFLSHNHHHHWHINYWASRVHSSRGGPLERVDYVRRALRFWARLGVDLRPFLAHLENVLDELRQSPAPSSATQLTVTKAEWLRQEVRDILPMISQDASVRTTLFRRAEELARADVENRRLWNDRVTWPNPNSRLHAAIETTLQIEGIIRDSANEYKRATAGKTQDEIQRWLLTQADEAQAERNVLDDMALELLRTDFEDEVELPGVEPPELRHMPFRDVFLGADHRPILP
jgi:hypothetical protein